MAGTYQVVSGDSLSKIAGKLTGVPNRWRELVEPNPWLKSRKDWVIYTTDVLKLPANWPSGVGPTPKPGPSPVPVDPTKKAEASMLSNPLLWGGALVVALLAIFSSKKETGQKSLGMAPKYTPRRRR